MIAKSRSVPYLQLVENKKTPLRSDASLDDSPFTQQVSLFSDATRSTLGFIAVTKMSDVTFQSLLEDMQPRFIFDLRRVPAFSIGVLSRKTVFALFDAYDIQYYDVAGAFEISGARDALANPRLLVPKIMRILLRRTQPLVGPVLFFVDDEYLEDRYLIGIAETLPHEDSRGWEISVWDEKPALRTASSERRIVFISHAYPEDNDVARWLAARLAAEGYDVWSDITKLTGGERIWDTIETTIRERAACVVVLLSKDGHQKPGVLDEVNIAVATERRLSIDNFVIPIRIDNLPFDEIRANIARKNIIDASVNLKDAFHSLLRTLEKMHVSRSFDFDVERSQNWHALHDSDHLDSTGLSNVLIGNIVKVIKWPDHLWKLRSGKSNLQIETSAISKFLATATVNDGLLCFGSKDELMNSVIELGPGSFSSPEDFTGRFDDGIVDRLELNWPDALRALAQIVNMSFDRLCFSSGLSAYRLASGKSCWFEPLSVESKNIVQFTDIDGRRKRRSLVGRSRKREVYWHFAIESHFDYRSQCLRLKSHVVFSEDGLTPIHSASKQHSLRRGFCKSWWNDKWRTLLQSMLFRLSKGEEIFELPVSPLQAIHVNTRLTKMEGSAESGTLLHLEEPKLEFGLRQMSEDPREGLMLFGPTDFERNPKFLRIGVVGAPEGINLFNRWCKNFRARIDSGSDDIDTRLVPFLGFDSVFGAEWPEKPLVAKAIPRIDLLNAIRISERHQAVAKAVGLYVNAIHSLRNADDVDVDIWFVVVPEEVFVLGRPKSRVPSSVAVAPASMLTRRMASRFSAKAPSLFDEDNQIARIFEFHTDFRHQLKNRLLEDKEVTQIFRESTIAHSLAELPKLDDDDFPGNNPSLEKELSDGSSRRMQGALDVHWNIGTASFFKAGGRPWKVSTARPGVCYVGLIFKQDRRSQGKNHCCGAQLFLESGEGVVFKGALGPWYSEESRQFHLSKEEARKLIGVAIDAYFDEHKVNPSEVFVHGRTRFNTEELDGFREAVPKGTEITGVRITRTSQVKLFTGGDLPVRRGTALLVSQNLGYLWTSGYVEHLKTYQGRETPNPLRVEICGPSTSCMEVVLKDIMTLTKMNFNSSIFADGYPVSMRFAEAIGDVLMATEGREIPPLPFRHYI